MTDLRRKLEVDDYQKIHNLDAMNYTIREIATEFGISTKYVKKILNNQVGSNWRSGRDLVYEDIRHHECSGCHRLFSFSGIAEHFAIWTSGNNPLSCLVTTIS